MKNTINTIKLSNPKKQPLTPEILRTFKGSEELTDKEATDIIIALDNVSRIFVAFHGCFTELCTDEKKLNFDYPNNLTENKIAA